MVGISTPSLSTALLRALVDCREQLDRSKYPKTYWIIGVYFDEVTGDYIGHGMGVYEIHDRPSWPGPTFPVAEIENLIPHLLDKLNQIVRMRHHNGHTREYFELYRVPERSSDVV